MLFAVLDSDKKGVRGCLDKDGYDSYRDMYDVKNDKCEDITYDSYTDAGTPPARVYIVNVLPCSHVFKHWRGNSRKSCEHCALENHTPTYPTAGLVTLILFCADIHNDITLISIVVLFVPYSGLHLSK